MSWDDAYIETRFVRVLRATADRTIASWEADGWELVARPSGLVLTELYFRRVKHRTSGAHARTGPGRKQVLAGVAALAVAGLAITVVTRGDDLAPPAQAVDTTAPAGTPAPTTTTTPTDEPTDEVLTVDDSDELGAALAEPDPCSGALATFADAHEGDSIDIDANVAATAVRPGSTYDVVLRAGDFATRPAVGPSFALQGITVDDLHLGADSGRDYVSKGDDVRITGVLGTFDSNACFLRLVLESTDLR